MSADTSPPSLGSLVRKAAVDAGFDLEPEVDDGWWRLRASGVSGVAWVRPWENANGVWLALPLAEQLLRVISEEAPNPRSAAIEEEPPQRPHGAAGVVALRAPESLHEALRRVWTHRARTPERLQARWEVEVSAALGVSASGAASTGPAAIMVATTEVVAEVRRRVGQNLFREALLDLWEGRCAVSGLTVPELLRASHAKPWADATDVERMDRYNGLLLAVHLDALFDRGFLTFDERGHGRWSSALPMSAADVLGLSGVAPSLQRVDPAHEKYLAWHGAHVFRP